VKKLRQEFADTMIEVGTADNRLVVMVGDISHGILQPFAEACPNRYYNVGICEPTIVNMAAGINKAGLIPVIHTIAPFITERSYEQIKLDFGYQQLSGNIVSVGGSFDYSQLGCSHHCYTDVSLICHLSRGVVVIPGSPLEFNKLFKDSYSNATINYFRLPDNPHGVVFNENDVKLGRGIRVRAGEDVTLIVTGSLLKNALSVAESLKAYGVSVEVLYFHTIKPFDSALVHESVLKTRKVVVAEELSAHDGLFNRCLHSFVGIRDVRFRQVAVEDFIYGYGSYDELCASIGLDVDSLCRTVSEICAG
jgi:transketolase